MSRRGGHGAGDEWCGIPTIQVFWVRRLFDIGPQTPADSIR